MNALAHALILACKHINSRNNSDSDDGVAVLEAVAAELISASEVEKRCLVQCAKALGDDLWLEEMGIF